MGSAWGSFRKGGLGHQEHHSRATEGWEVAEAHVHPTRGVKGGKGSRYGARGVKGWELAT